MMSSQFQVMGFPNTIYIFCLVQFCWGTAGGYSGNLITVKRKYGSADGVDQQWGLRLSSCKTYPNEHLDFRNFGRLEVYEHATSSWKTYRWGICGIFSDFWLTSNDQGIFFPTDEGFENFFKPKAFCYTAATRPSVTFFQGGMTVHFPETSCVEAFDYKMEYTGRLYVSSPVGKPMV